MANSAARTDGMIAIMRIAAGRIRIGARQRADRMRTAERPAASSAEEIIIADIRETTVREIRIPSRITNKEWGWTCRK